MRMHQIARRGADPLQSIGETPCRTDREHTPQKSRFKRQCGGFYSAYFTVKRAGSEAVFTETRENFLRVELLKPRREIQRRNDFEFAQSGEFNRLFRDEYPEMREILARPKMGN